MTNRGAARTLSRWIAASLFVILISPATAQQPAQDAHSLCLPTGDPPTGGYAPYTGAVRTRAEVVIGGVPGYQWRHGCGPTAAGMVVGYWDGNGFPALIPGDASSQTTAVNQAMASTGHYTDYSLPIDDPGTGLLPDASYYGGAHPSDSLGDFMETSWYTRQNYYGWSWFSDVDNALREYVDYVNASEGTAYLADSWNEYWGTFTWSTFVTEIDSSRPLVFLVDTDGDGWTDHFVTAIGYRDTYGYQEYACLDTWSPPASIRWERFRGIQAGNAWGIYGATYCTLTDGGITDCNSNGIDDAEDIASGTSQDCNNNAVPDECDIADGTSMDVNSNGVPDECEDDCNSNGIPDDYDIATGASEDCNDNAVPDECDIADGTSLDVNENGIPDECEALTPPYFQGLGDLPGGEFHSEAQAVSADGLTVVGVSASADGDQAFRWTAQDGPVGLGDLSGGSFQSKARGVSGDGSVVVGASDGWAPEVAFRWTAEEGMVALGLLFGGDYSSRALAVSADGSVIVGTANSANGDEAFHWNADQGMTGLGDLAGGGFGSEAQGASADGSVIVGAGTVTDDMQPWAFRWTEPAGMVPLQPEDYLEADVACTANTISSDGSTIIGTYWLAPPYDTTVAFRWNQEAGFRWLHEPSEESNGCATAVSSDGTAIVGWHSQLGAFIWDNPGDALSLQTVLEVRYRLDLAGWAMTTATGISADGLTIVGTGTNASGQTEGWITKLPWPADLDLDGDTDPDDWVLFETCFVGVCGEAPCEPPIYPDPLCSVCDFDTEGDIDLADFAGFQTAFGREE